MSDFFEVDQKYFRSGAVDTIIFVEQDLLDFSDEQVQNKIHMMTVAIEECWDCEQDWHQPRSTRSWYIDFTNWVSEGSCSFLTPATIPGEKIVVP